MAKKKNNKNLKIDLGIVLALLLASLLFLVYFGFFSTTGNVVYEKSFYDTFYDEDICRCLERERQVCSLDGFELEPENRLCRKGNLVTNPLLKCSAYECSGVEYRFNFELNNWEENLE